MGLGMPQMCEKTVIDEGGWVKIPSAIRAQMGLLEKTDIIVTSYSDGIIIVRSVSDNKLEGVIKNIQARLKVEEAFGTIHAKNLGMSDEEIAGEIREYRRAKRENEPAG